MFKLMISLKTTKYLNCYSLSKTP